MKIQVTKRRGGFVDNLRGQQLLAGAELRVNKPINEEPDEDEPVQDHERPYTRPGLKKITWIKGDIIPNEKVFPVPDYSRFENLTDVEIFEQFFDQEIVDLLVEQSNKYALFKSSRS